MAEGLRPWPWPGNFCFHLTSKLNEKDVVERWLVPDPAGSVGINHGWARSQTSLMASIYCRRHNISSWVVRRNIILNKSSLITPFPERFPLQLNQRWTGTLNKSTVDRGVCERDERENTRVCLCECDTEREIDGPPCYIILSSHAIVLRSVEGARECVWCWLSPVPPG